jgi:N-ethylmaleimide reductase
MSKLFTSVRIGALDLGHRVVHAPTTRLRALPDETPSSMMVDYYRQRASQGGTVHHRVRPSRS